MLFFSGLQISMFVDHKTSNCSWGRPTGKTMSPCHHVMGMGQSTGKIMSPQIIQVKVFLCLLMERIPDFLTIFFPGCGPSEEHPVTCDRSLQEDRLRLPNASRHHPCSSRIRCRNIFKVLIFVCFVLSGENLRTAL